MRYNALLAAAIIASPSLLPRPTAQETDAPPETKEKDVHTAMPEGGWPETRQQRRLKERKMVRGLKRYD